ncbi:hypothetical protein [Archangium sp.]|uniref:hypothetical protein n=1 Tax=Archangium sp. TaxID=1872627 RepID=UPI00389A9CBB
MMTSAIGQMRAAALVALLLASTSTSAHGQQFPSLESRDELGFLDAGTRLYGQIWTGGPNVVIRYYEARPPDADPIPSARWPVWVMAN